jgi:Glycosyltransferase WbsX
VRRSLALFAAVSLVVVAAAPSRPADVPSVPNARVGAIYFDGWACPLSNFHFNGLLYSPFSGREPLYGWRDNSVESMRTQMTWAHQDGIGFFLFDWYRENVDPCLDVALQNYKSLSDHHGVGFALLLVHNDVFTISPSEWPAFAERWVTEDFLNPDYERVDGKPLFVILDTTLFRQEMGGTDGVNAALATLRATAERHGLPGVFIVGGRYTDYLNIGCFPACDATDGGPNGLRLERYDALSEYASTGAAVPVSGARPYSDLVTAAQAEWRRFAQASPIPYIPSVMDGWDPRPWDERPYGDLFWFIRTPPQVAAFVRDAIAWIGANPPMRVGAASSPPLVLIEAWNELGEGGYVIPTRNEGYAYGRALASTLGLPWSTIHPRQVTFGATNRNGTGTVRVVDDWTPCEVARVRIERKVRNHWIIVGTATTQPGGVFSATLPHRRGTYRASVPHVLRYRQTCGASSSAPILIG